MRPVGRHRLRSKRVDGGQDVLAEHLEGAVAGMVVIEKGRVGGGCNDDSVREQVFQRGHLELAEVDIESAEHHEVAADFVERARRVVESEKLGRVETTSSQASAQGVGGGIGGTADEDVGMRFVLEQLEDALDEHFCFPCAWRTRDQKGHLSLPKDDGSDGFLLFWVELGVEPVERVFRRPVDWCRRHIFLRREEP